MSQNPPPNPLTAGPSDAARDAELADAAARGDEKALTALVRRHQPWIYSLALRLVLRPPDAEDLAQEALIRIVTRIGQFEGRSAFRTWAWRIVVNCFRDRKRQPMEQAITTFAALGADLDALPLEPLSVPGRSNPELALIVEEARLGCMMGMLLCLDREQRLCFVLGEIFEAPAAVAAEILDIKPANFRQRLARARADLHRFMHEKCGLVRAGNPCRCPKKTNAFIREGWVDPERLKFTAPHLSRISAAAQAACGPVDELAEEAFGVLFRAHPLQEGPDVSARLKGLLAGEQAKAVLDL